MRKLIDESAQEAGLTGDEWEGRIDLALSSGSHLLILEFMRPKLKLDWDHLDRFERYVRIIRTKISAITAGPFDTVTGYIVADRLEENAAMLTKITDMKAHHMSALDWPTLFSNALSRWREFLDILLSRAPDDERLQSLKEA